MSVEIYIKRAARRELMKTVLEEWLARSPGEAKEALRYIKEISAQDINKGKWKETGAGKISIRFPSDLFFLLRMTIKGWGDDTKDMYEFLEDFPDLVPLETRRQLKVPSRLRKKKAK